MGQPPGRAQGTSQWYLIDRRGVVVRVRQGMRLGETAAGELSFDPSCAQLEMDNAEDGGLTLGAVDDHALESSAGTRYRSERLTRSRRAEIRLAHNFVQLEPDFVDPTRVTKTVELRVVRTNDEVAAPQIGRRSWGSLQLDQCIEFLRHTGRRSNARPRRTAGTREQPTLGDLPSRLTPSVADAEEQALGEGSRQQRIKWMGSRRQGVRGPLIALLVVLAGIGIVVLHSARRDGAENSEQDEWRAGAPLALTTPSPDVPPEIEHPNSPSGALPMTSPNPLPEPDQAAAPTAEAVASSVKPASNPQAVPLARNDLARNVGAKTTRAQGHASGAAARPEPGKTSREKAVALATERALAAANQALADGRLTSPPEANAYTLYNRVLALDPRSAGAEKGLQSVRQGVVNRALAELATRRLDDARRSLKTAAEVGADPLLLANLQNEVDYQQRLTGERAQ